MVKDGCGLLDEPVEGSIHRSVRADAIEWQIQGVELVERHRILVEHQQMLSPADISELVERIAILLAQKGITHCDTGCTICTIWTELCLRAVAVQFELHVAASIDLVVVQLVCQLI